MILLEAARLHVNLHQNENLYISGPSHEDHSAVLAVGRWLEESELSRRPTLKDY